MLYGRTLYFLCIYDEKEFGLNLHKFYPFQHCINMQNAFRREDLTPGVGNFIFKRKYFSPFYFQLFWLSVGLSFPIRVPEVKFTVP